MIDPLDLAKIAGAVASPVLGLLGIAWKSMSTKFEKINDRIDMLITAEAVKSEKISHIDQDVSLTRLDMAEVRSELHRHLTEDAEKFANLGARVDGLERRAS